MAVTGDPPGDVARLFAEERAHLIDALSALRSSDWPKPTPCPQWTILPLACHLLGDDFSLLARHRDQHLGTVAPLGSDEPAFIAWLDDLQMGWVQAARRLSPRLVVELLAWTAPQVVDLFQSQDPLALSGHVSWAGPVPVWLDHARELSEYWIHRQQLRLGRLVGELAMSTDEAWRLLTNNLPVYDAARLKLSGDDAIVDVLRRTRSIIGTPSKRWRERSIGPASALQRSTARHQWRTFGSSTANDQYAANQRRVGSNNSCRSAARNQLMATSTSAGVAVGVISSEAR